jgi:beta-aspartyl-peptidase (threonine type)
MRSLIVHGGAWQIPNDEVEDHCSGLARALERGVALLRAGRPALEVVVETVSLLEDDPTFDAGCGSVLNLDGEIEMDASVMDGSTRRAGSCVAVRDVTNPIRLAHCILQDGRAAMLAGDGASQFARAAGVSTCDSKDLLVERETRRKEYLDSLDAYKTRQPFDGSLPDRPASPPYPSGTVGAVCNDVRGHLAAATSTGGAPNTLPGRIGDSPIIGAGTWTAWGRQAAQAGGSRSSATYSPFGRSRKSTRSRFHGKGGRHGGKPRDRLEIGSAGVLCLRG